MDTYNPESTDIIFEDGDINQFEYSINLMSTFIDTFIRYQEFLNGNEDGESWKKLIKVDQKTDSQIKKIFDLQLKYITHIAQEEIKQITE